MKGLTASKAHLFAVELESWQVSLDITAKVTKFVIQGSLFPAISSTFALHFLQVIEDEPNWRI